MRIGESRGTVIRICSDVNEKLFCLSPRRSKDVTIAAMYAAIVLQLLLLIIEVLAFSPPQQVTKPATQPVGPWRLVWSDEFDYNGLPDPKKWDYDVGGQGWGHNELQFYPAPRKAKAIGLTGDLKCGRSYLQDEAHGPQSRCYRPVGPMAGGPGAARSTSWNMLVSILT